MQHGAADGPKTIASLLGLGRADALMPLDARVGPSTIVDGIGRQRIELDGPDGDIVPCTLLTPETSNGASVIAVHQHADDYARGREEVIGAYGDLPAAIGLGLARRGFTVLAPDLLGFGERRRGWSRSDGDDERTDALHRIAAGSSLQAKHCLDLAVATSWLHARSAEPERIGVVGHSLGGQLAVFSMAFDERLRAGAVSCGLSTVAAIVRDRIPHNPAWFVPGIVPAGDLGAVVASIRPRRLVVAAGRRDELFPADGVAAASASAELHWTDGGHEVAPGFLDLAEPVLLLDG